MTRTTLTSEKGDMVHWWLLNLSCSFTLHPPLPQLHATYITLKMEVLREEWAWGPHNFSIISKKSELFTPSDINHKSKSVMVNTDLWSTPFQITSSLYNFRKHSHTFHVSCVIIKCTPICIFKKISLDFKNVLYHSWILVFCTTHLLVLLLWIQS